jgi:hypothetical protein
MITLEIPPGFIVHTEAQKAAWDNGFRLDLGVEGSWLRYASTTAPGSVWVAGASQRGPWLLLIDHPGVAVEVGATAASPVLGPGTATFIYETLERVVVNTLDCELYELPTEEPLHCSGSTASRFRGGLRDPCRATSWCAHCRQLRTFLR